MSHPPSPASPESAEPTTRRPPVVKIVAALLVLVLVGGAGAVAVVTLTGPTEHTIELTDTAGGMQRDTALEQELGADLQAAEERFVEQLSTAGEDGERVLEYSRVGIYDQTDEEVGPVGGVALIGVKASGQQDPEAYIAGVEANAEQNGFETERVPAGDEAVGACATQPSPEGEPAEGEEAVAGGLVICAWATNDTVGQLVPTAPGWTAEQLAPLMVDVRADVETTD